MEIRGNDTGDAFVSSFIGTADEINKLQRRTVSRRVALEYCGAIISPAILELGIYSTLISIFTRDSRNHFPRRDLDLIIESSTSKPFERCCSISRTVRPRPIIPSYSPRGTPNLWQKTNAPKIDADESSREVHFACGNRINRAR